MKASTSKTLQSMLTNLISAQDDVTYYNVKVGTIEDNDRQDEYIHLMRKAQAQREYFRREIIRFIDLLLESGVQ
jgi:hypothetical protein